MQGMLSIAFYFEIRSVNKPVDDECKTKHHCSAMYEKAPSRMCALWHTHFYSY